MRKGKKGLLMLSSSLLAAFLMITWPVKNVLEVRTAVIESGELVQTLLASGTVTYDEQHFCITPKSGRIDRIYAKQGQLIQKGQLLFKLDVSAEEQAMAALHQQKYVQEYMIRNWEEDASALFLQNQLEWQSLENQLKLSVEASQIRALSDGIMNEVYVQEGQYVEASALLGMMHGSNVQIAATINAYDAFGLTSGTTGIAVIDNISVPVILVQKSGPDKQGTQTLWFKPLNEEAIKNLQTGDYARLEITQKTNPVSALIPFSAVDPEEQIWIVENGKAYALQIETNECNRTHIRAELGLVGKSVILHPEQYELKNGMPVRVMK